MRKKHSSADARAVEGPALSVDEPGELSKSVADARAVEGPALSVDEPGELSKSVADARARHEDQDSDLCLQCRSHPPIVKGLDPRINPDKPPRNFRDAMKALDKQAWAAAYNSESLGFRQREVFKLVKQEPGVRIHDTLTRLECKEDNGEFLECKVCLCTRVDQLEQILESASRN